MTVGRICVREVDLAAGNESVQVAARRMHDRKVGTLLVLDEQRRPIGILTDRDLTVRVLAEALDPAQTLVSQVMTKDPKVIEEEASLERAIAIMRSGPFRRVAVVDKEGRLAGLLSMDDVLDLLREEMNEIGELIRRESPGSLAGA